MNKTYIHTDDFLFSDDFNEFVLSESEQQKKSWDSYFKKYPDTIEEAEKAKKILAGLGSMKDRTSIREIDEAKLHSQFEETWEQFRDEKSKTVMLRVSKAVFRSVSVAAVLVFVFLVYSVVHNFVSSKFSNPEYFEVVVPSAKQSQISLPDGTKVWVNSETKIRYSNQFNSKERNIYLTGEAYFEVNKNKDLPLHVFTNGADIKVVGTKFNVKGYAEDKRIETVLVEGKIELSRVGDRSGRSIELQPGDKAILDLKTSKVAISREDVMDDVAWKDGKMVYRNVPLKEVCKSLSRRFGAEIILSGDTESLYEHPFTFTIENETLPLVLEYLCKAAPLMFNTEYIDIDGEKGIEKIKYTISAR